MILAARKADIIMYNGLDLEIGYLPRIIESANNPKIQPGRPGNLDCSRFVDTIERSSTVDRSMGDVHPLGNPHYHFSPKNIAGVVEGIAQALSRVDAANEGLYQANARTFRERLKEKEKEWSSKPLKGKKYVTYHKLLEYMAREYGFEIVGYIEPKPGIPPSAGHLSAMVETIKKTRPHAIIATEISGKKEAASLSQMTGDKAVIVPHDVGATASTPDWFSLIDEVMKSLE
jgi:zinc/manganese transport system substrate-binding protein